MSYKRISLYLGFEFFISFGVAFLFFFFVFFINHILLLIEDILSKDIPIGDVGLLVIYALPRIFSFTFPFSTVVGALMACGRFISHNEFLAMQASGISYRRIFYPFLIIAGILTLMSFSINDYFIPWGTVNTYKLKARLLQENPELDLEPYSKKQIDKTTIITGDIDGKTIYDLMILDRTNENDKRVIMAGKASIVSNPEQNDVISFKLYNVFSHTTEKNQTEEFNYFQSDEMIYNILLKDIYVSEGGISASEMRTADIYKSIEEKLIVLGQKKEVHLQEVNISYSVFLHSYMEASGQTNVVKALSGANMILVKNRFSEYSKLLEKEIVDRSLHRDLVELNNKFSLPFGCIAFVLLAYPVSLFSKRSGWSVGFIVGIIFSAVYWGLIFVGYRLARSPDFSPAIAMWLPNIVILFFSGVFFILRFKK